MSRPLPAIGPARRLPPAHVQQRDLSCGARLHVVEMRDLPIVDLQIVFCIGAEIDPPDLAGRVSMTCEMLDEGTPTRDALAIAEQVDFLGGYLDVQAGWDASSISLHVQSSRLGAALDVAADIILNATFPESEFARKQKEHISALHQEHDEADILAAKALAAGVFGAAHPYAAPLGGTVASISRLDREKTHQVYEKHFRADNMFGVVSGDVDTDALASMLDARFGKLTAGLARRSHGDARVAVSERRVLLVDKPGAAQAELRVGHSAPPRTTADFFALVVLNTILGGSFTSRLNTILRERLGVTYGASSHFRLRRHGGIFSAGTAVSTESAARSARVVVDEMKRVQDEQVGSAELRRAQSYIALGLPRSFETNQDVIAHLREQILYDLPPDYWQTYVDRIFAITAADVAAAAARHLHPSSCAIVIVADCKEVRAELESANLGNVILTDVKA